MADLSIQRFSSPAQAKQHYLSLVDNEAEVARYISPAQEAVYQLKLAEAVNGSGPRVTAEAAATGVSVAIVCKRIKRARSTWIRRAGIVEDARIAAKADIRNSTTPADMHRALSRFRTAIGE